MEIGQNVGRRIASLDTLLPNGATEQHTVLQLYGSGPQYAYLREIRGEDVTKTQPKVISGNTIEEIEKYLPDKLASRVYNTLQIKRGKR
jgi:hypothetical protein